MVDVWMKHIGRYVVIDGRNCTGVKNKDKGN